MNEYQKTFQALGTDFLASIKRWDLCQVYSWAIPSDAALDILTKYSPLVEIGAGGGYWAHLLRQRGVDIIAYDIKPGRNDWVKKQWTKVRRGGPEKLKKLPDRTLFLCWPPYDTPMGTNCLKNYRGNTVIYIGEHAGGCTGNDEFHGILDRQFKLINTQEIPQWYGIHDVMFVYRRLKHGR